jgi:hypothetical protein
VLLFDAGLVASFDAGLLALFDAGLLALFDAGLVASAASVARRIDGVLHVGHLRASKDLLEKRVQPPEPASVPTAKRSLATTPAQVMPIANRSLVPPDATCKISGRFRPN